MLPITKLAFAVWPARKSGLKRSSVLPAEQGVVVVRTLRDHGAHCVNRAAFLPERISFLPKKLAGKIPTGFSDWLLWTGELLRSNSHCFRSCFLKYCSLKEISKVASSPGSRDTLLLTRGIFLLQQFHRLKQFALLFAAVF